MSAPQKLVDTVRDILKKKAAREDHKATRHGVALEVWGKVKGLGGPTKFGIGAAMVQMATIKIIEDEVSRQFKAKMTEHDFKFRLVKSTPMETIAAFGKIPSQWISIGEGMDAEWVYALEATALQWKQNANLKGKKAQQTQVKADVSQEIADFLERHRFKSLAEAMTKGV
jgi:hypothetical protein